VSTHVSIDRTSLGKAALIIGSDGAAPYSLTATGLGRPAVTARANAVSSPWLHGETVVSVVREQSSLPFEVLLQAHNDENLELVRYALDEALWQFSYQVTVTEGETAHTWLCSPASYGTDSVAFSNVAGCFEVWTITVPCYPIPVV
jgi:hypothetical protein